MNGSNDENTSIRTLCNIIATMENEMTYLGESGKKPAIFIVTDGSRISFRSHIEQQDKCARY